MEPIFKNHCCYSKEILLELTKASRKALRIALCAVVLLYCLIVAFFCFVFESYGYAIILLLLAIGFFIFCLYVPHLNANKTYKRYLTLYHVPVETETVFSQAQIIGYNLQTGGQTHIDYNQIQKVTQTDHLYLLRLSQQLVLLIDKQDFSVGDPREFLSFLKQKAPQAVFNIPKGK